MEKKGGLIVCCFGYGIIRVMKAKGRVVVSRVGGVKSAPRK